MSYIMSGPCMLWVREKVNDFRQCVFNNYEYEPMQLYWIIKASNESF